MPDPVPGPDPTRAERLRRELADLERAIAEESARAALSARAQARRRAEGIDRLIAGVIEEAIAESRPGAARGAGANGKPDTQLSLPALATGRPKRSRRVSHGHAVEFAVVATGGYGRAELSPRSDVDLLFLVPRGRGAAGARERQLVERILYDLWDSGLEIGHSVRTVAECVEVGKREVTARSALLDHRYVAGDRDLYASFASHLERRLFRADAAGFVGAKLLEIARRRERWGTAVSRNEPNVKEGEGGLRDAHTALWIARAVWGIADAPGLIARGLARAEDVAEFEASFEKLLQVRARLHELAGRKEDRLAFDRQPQVAEALGYSADAGASATERFMQELTQAMASVQRFLQLVVDRMPDRFHARADKMGARGLVHVPEAADRSARLRDRSIRIRRGRLLFADPVRAMDNPVEMIRIFAVSAERDLPLHPESRDLIRRERERIGEVRDQSAAAHAFLELLLNPAGDRVERALLEMNDLGALGALIPEFRALYYRVQHDSYHVYTSDAHLIVAAANVHRLLGGAWDEAEPRLTEVARRVPLRTLVLGVFLHDIGKSQRGHTEAGLRMLPAISKRLHMAEGEYRDVWFLTEQHLLMSHVAQRRDLSDPRTIADFVEKVGTRERLDLLYALTFCDIQAVGPGTWTAWKGALLRELHEKATSAIEHGPASVEQELARRAEETRRGARTYLPARVHDAGAAEFLERFLAVLPARYFGQTDPEGVVDDFVLHRSVDRQGLKVAARVLPERRATEVTFIAKDRPGLFADLTGALSAAGLSIRTARIHTTRDGLVIDRFEVAGGDGAAVDLQVLDRMVRDLLWVLTGKQTADELLARRKAPVYGRGHVPEKPPRVEIHNDASDEATVVDVFAHDRLGLLHDIASVLSRHRLDVDVAIVSTKVDQVADSFYVRELGASKLNDPSKIESLRADLLQIL